MDLGSYRENDRILEVLQDCHLMSWSTRIACGVVKVCTRSGMRLLNCKRVAAQPVKLTIQLPTCKDSEFQIGCPGVVRW